jgi:hypothetical protein
VIYTPGYNIKLWRVLMNGTMLIGLLITVVGCGKKPPTIIGFEPSHPIVVVNDGIRITVNFAPNDYNIHDFVWRAEEGKILGDGPTITYRAPATPGSYNISVELQYSGKTVKDSIIVEVVLMTASSTSTPTDQPTSVPTETSTSTPTSTPTSPSARTKATTATPSSTATSTPTIIVPPTPTPSSTATPTPPPSPPITPTITIVPAPPPTHTLIATPTPTPYPPPVLGEPVDGITSAGRLPPLSWNWERALAEDEYFEVRIWHNGDPYHTGIVWVKRSPFDFNLEGFPTGKYFWSIAVMRGRAQSKGWPGIEAWEGINPVIQLSKESEIRSFFLSMDDDCERDRHGKCK